MPKTSLPPFFFYLLFFLFSSCSHLFYQPTSNRYSTPGQFKLSAEDIFFSVPEENIPENTLKLHGLLLHAYNVKTSIPLGTLVFFHGNAQNLSSHFHHLAWATQYGYDVFIFDYRGYGESEGIPDQLGVEKDAITAITLAQELQLKRKAKKLFIYGHSLGGTIALHAVSLLPKEKQRNIDGMIIEASFASYRDIAKNKLQQAWFLYPFSWLTPLLVSDLTAPKSQITKNLHIPLLVVHGEQDPIIPVSFGEEIYHLSSSPKWILKVQGGDHNNIFHFHPQREEWRKKLLTFLQSSTLPSNL